MEAYSHFYRWGEKKKKGIERDKVDLSKQRPGLEAKALDRRSSAFPEASGSHLICLSVSLWTQTVAGEGVPWSVGFGRSGAGLENRPFFTRCCRCCCGQGWSSDHTFLVLHPVSLCHMGAGALLGKVRLLPMPVTQCQLVTIACLWHLIHNKEMLPELASVFPWHKGSAIGPVKHVKNLSCSVYFG